MPFFTAIDSRAEVKGSRDPLGLVPLWSRLGRRFVGNLTTASASARGFTTLLIGYHLAETLSEAHEEVRPLDVFLRFEQVAAYTRLYLNDDAGFRGERRARRMQAKTTRPPIGIDSDTQILSDQKTYGLWGLYSMPARSSGLVRHGEPGLTSVGRELVERLYLNVIRAGGRRLEQQLLNLVRKDGHYAIEGQHADLAAVLQKLFAPRFARAEQEAFDYHLINGGPDDRTGGEQAPLAALLRTLPPEQPFGFGPLEVIIGEAHRRPGHEMLARNLEKARDVEHVIVPLQAIFLFALSRDGMSVRTIAEEIASAWGPLAHVRPEGFARVREDIAAVYGLDAADRLTEAAEALAHGDHEVVLRAVLAHNQFIMRDRNGSEAWARLDGELLNVRYRDETDSLPDRSELPLLWRSTYFIDSLKSMIDQVDT